MVLTRTEVLSQVDLHTAFNNSRKDNCDLEKQPLIRNRLDSYHNKQQQYGIQGKNRNPLEIIMTSTLYILSKVKYRG